MKVGDKVVRDDGATGEVAGINEGRVAIAYAMGYAVAAEASGKQYHPTTYPELYWKLAPRTVRCRFWVWDDEPDRVVIEQIEADTDLDGDQPDGGHFVGGIVDIEVPSMTLQHLTQDEKSGGDSGAGEQ